jgi:hypothetical protein
MRGRGATSHSRAGVARRLDSTLMAFIGSFETRPLDPKRVHGEVLCGYACVSIGSRRILQLETYGFVNRQMPDKVSQSIQLDENGARELKAILERSFPGL